MSLPYHISLSSLTPITEYMFPDDEIEQDRLDIKYASLNLMFGNKIVFAPIKDPQQILDIGTGTGIW